MWNHVVENPSSQSVADLFDNRFAAIQVRGFLTPEQNQKIVDAVRAWGLIVYNYQHATDVPKAQHLFETHYLYEDKKPEEYFAITPHVIEDYRRFCKEIGFDPALLFADSIQRLTGSPVRIAEQDGQMYTYAIVRELQNSALLHADYAHFLDAKWSLSRIVKQFAWNIYLTDPQDGGDVVVYNHPWSRQDDQWQIGQTYGYSHEVVKGAERCAIQVAPRQLVIFNSRNFHEVTASSQMRLSIGGHLGVDADGHMWIWV